MDVWPANRQEGPVRIEFFDDEIESLRALDPRTRRGIGAVEQLRMLAQIAGIDEIARLFGCCGVGDDVREKDRQRQQELNQWSQPTQPSKGRSIGPAMSRPHSSAPQRPQARGTVL